jgi:membrane protein required for colicin V production
MAPGRGFAGGVLRLPDAGAWRGLVYEVFRWWAGWWPSGRLFAGDVGAWLPVDGWDPTVRYAAGFVLLCGGGVRLGAAGALAKQLIEAVGLRPVDRTLGALFGVLRGMVLVLVVTLVVVNTPLHQQDWWVQSWAGPQLADLARTLVPSLPQGWASA